MKKLAKINRKVFLTNPTNNRHSWLHVAKLCHTNFTSSSFLNPYIIFNDQHTSFTISMNCQNNKTTSIVSVIHPLLLQVQK